MSDQTKPKYRFHYALGYVPDYSVKLYRQPGQPLPRYPPKRAPTTSNHPLPNQRPTSNNPLPIERLQPGPELETRAQRIKARMDEIRKEAAEERQEMEDREKEKNIAPICSICLADRDDGPWVALNNYGCRLHPLHEKCLQGWFSTGGVNCPVCRAPETILAGLKYMKVSPPPGSLAHQKEYEDQFDALAKKITLQLAARNMGFNLEEILEQHSTLLNDLDHLPTEVHIVERKIYSLQKELDALKIQVKETPTKLAAFEKKFCQFLNPVHLHTTPQKN